MQHSVPDPRHVGNGNAIPTESYSDQPYILRADDGAWVCVLTTGAGHEGQKGQHIVSFRSTDQGRTWSQPVDIEPPDGPEASYAVLLKTHSGRIYVFYNHNTDRVAEVRREDEGAFSRVDSLGHFVFKYSDDHGMNWSEQRYDIPVRKFACDLNNVYGGDLCFFWNVGKAFSIGDDAYVPHIKVGAMGVGFFAQSEGVLLHSPNLMTEPDPERIAWETLPDGVVGLRTPPGGGRISEEQSYCVMSDGSFYCVYRTVDGYPVEAYSRDGGHTWTTPRYKCYADGRRMKHPRAANFAWRCSNGKYLYWFHNHGGRSIPLHDPTGYEDRNPIWLSMGEEVRTAEGLVIKWSEPEIALYDDDPYIRMSYPDLIEDDGRLYLTETNKDLARVHEIDAGFLGKLFGQFEADTVADEGLLLQLPEPGAEMPSSVAIPDLPALLQRDHRAGDYRTQDNRAGFTTELRATFEHLRPGQVLLHSRSEDGRGILLQTAEAGTVELVLNDGRTECRWGCDPGLLTPRQEHHIGIIVDGGPKIISFIVDGKLNDGGEHRQFGWGRYSPNLRTPTGSDTLRITASLSGRLSLLRIYNRALMVSELIGNCRSGI